MPKVKKIELSFVCDEDWNKMKPVNTGRHCDSCQKTVVNFSTMSDAQIVAFYSKKENEKTCGQFRNGQLEHINNALTRPEKRPKSSFFRPILASALLSAAACTPEKHLRGTPTVEVKQKTDSTTLSLGKVEALKDTLTSTQDKKFKPRKVTHVTSLKKSTVDTTKYTDFQPVIISEEEIPYPEERYDQLGGVPAISFEEEILHKKGEVELTPAKDKSSWFKRIFRKKQ